MEVNGASYLTDLTGNVDQTAPMKAVIAAMKAAGAKVKLILPPGRIWVQPNEVVFDFPNQNIGIEGAGPLLTEFVDRSPRGTLLTFKTCPGALLTGFAATAEVEKETGTLIDLRNLYDVTLAHVRALEGFIGVKLTGCSGVNLEDVSARGGNLFKSIADYGHKPGSRLVWLAPGETPEEANNSVVLNNCHLDPSSLEPAKRSNYMTALEVSHCDGLNVIGGHYAGANIAHVLMNPTKTAQVTAVTIGCGAHIDYYAHNCISVLADMGGSSNAIKVNNCILQGALGDAIYVNAKDLFGFEATSNTIQFNRQAALAIYGLTNGKVDGNNIYGNNSKEIHGSTMILAGKTSAISVNNNNVRGNNQPWYNLNCNHGVSNVYGRGNMFSGAAASNVVAHPGSRNIDVTGAEL